MGHWPSLLGQDCRILVLIFLCMLYWPQLDLCPHTKKNKAKFLYLDKISLVKTGKRTLHVFSYGTKRAILSREEGTWLTCLLRWPITAQESIHLAWKRKWPYNKQLYRLTVPVSHQDHIWSMLKQLQMLSPQIGRWGHHQTGVVLTA